MISLAAEILFAINRAIVFALEPYVELAPRIRIRKDEQRPE